jgi:hypothetical protein
MNYYLRVEGVNLQPFIGDTQDLSTIRGGGLLLLRSVEDVEKTFINLSPISTGASSGIFSFDADSEEDAESLRNQVAAFLAGDPQYSHATFVVDIQQAGSSFLYDREAVLARNRWRQWQQPTVVVPVHNDDISNPVCEVDMVRPGINKVKMKGDFSTSVSTSVAVRRKYGKDQKQTFYTLELEKHFGREDNVDYQFVADLEALTNDTTQGNLHHKMAVIYLDGNSFGKIQTELCKAISSQREFDGLMKRNRAEALKALLESMKKDAAYQTDTGECRLETLLWGGDELRWVVPAWRGWDALDLFYNVSKDWKFEGRALTHAAGIVYCHHNAPIHRIVRLVQSLADAAKRDAKRSEPPQNLFQYVVLESFDHVGNDLDHFRKRQCPETWKQSLEGEQMSAVAEAFRELKQEFPRNKIFAGVHAALLDARDGDASSNIYSERFDARLKKVLPRDVYNRINSENSEFRRCFGGPPGLWLHLADLWDYIPEEPH